MGALKITDDSKKLRLESKLIGDTLLLAEDGIMTNDTLLTGNVLKFNADINSHKGCFHWKDGDERYHVR